MLNANAARRLTAARAESLNIKRNNLGKKKGTACSSQNLTKNILRQAAFRPWREWTERRAARRARRRLERFELEVAQRVAEGGALGGELAWFHDEFIITEDAGYYYVDVTDAASAAPATRRRRTRQTEGCFWARDFFLLRTVECSRRLKIR